MGYSSRSAFGLLLALAALVGTSGTAHALCNLPPNDFQDLATGVATRVLATIDGNGALLVPFDYRKVLPLGPAAPVARLLNGTTTIDAFSSAPGQPIVVPSSSFVRSFTIDGKPVPPLLRATSPGTGIFGASDGVLGIVRVARTDGQGGPATLQDGGADTMREDGGERS